MSLQGLGNTTVQVPSSLRAPSDVSALGSIHQGIDQSGLPTPQREQIKSSVDKIYQSGDNVTLNNTDKRVLNPILNAGVHQGNLSLNPAEQSTLTGMQDKMNTSGTSTLNSGEKSLFRKIIDAIISFFSKIGEFIKDLFSNKSSQGSFDASTISQQAQNNMRQGSSTPNIPIPQGNPNGVSAQPDALPDPASLEKNGNPPSVIPNQPSQKPRLDDHNQALPDPALLEQAGATRVVTAPSGKGAENFDNYMNLAKERGAKVDLTPGKKNIITIRKPTNPSANGGKGLYDDNTAVFWIDKNGNKRVEEFQSNADPSSQYAGRGFNKNSGRIKEGAYTYHQDGQGRLAPASPVQVERFINGKFMDTDEYKNDFLIHSGASASNTGSAGCQTMEPNEYKRFLDIINSDGDPQDISYTLVNANK